MSHPSQADGASPAELVAMERALELARTPGVPWGPNPRVGCVLLDAAGHVLAEGLHRGAGTPHAEVDALTHAGGLARGATAVVTLEPCAHTGRTGPCVQALLAAGVARVVFGQADPNPVAAGGAELLTRAGVPVVGGVLADRALALNEAWTTAVTLGRSFVTWKVASTLDGRIAARDGSSRWITSSPARTDVHRLRAGVDAALVGTGTVLADDPSLTVRDTAGLPVGRQPLRVVMGRRPVPPDARLRDGVAPLRVFPEESPREVLEALHAADVQHVLLEAGPTLAAAFVRAGLVDRFIWYLAPKLLGAGMAALADVGVAGIGDAVPVTITDVTLIGPDLRVTGRPIDPPIGARAAGGGSTP